MPQYFKDVPDGTMLIRWVQQIKPDTLKALHERVMKMAFELKVTRGRKLCRGGTMVEANIYYPTDSGLLSDGVRVLSRLGRNMFEVIQIINQLGENGVEVIFVRQPELSTAGSQRKLLLAIYSYFAEAERDFISIRTKRGLAAA